MNIATVLKTSMALPLTLALAAAGFLLLSLAQISPALAAVTCGSWEQGTLDADGNWTAGSGTDYRVQCVGDSAGGKVSAGDLPTPPQGTGRLVVETSGTISASDDRERGVRLRSFDVEDIGRLVVINRGSISTNGDEFAYGISVRSNASANAEASALNTGTVSTSGTAGHGVFARILPGGSGTATAINEGSITTSGGTHEWDSGSGLRLIGSDGLKANNEGAGDAAATNQAGATIRTSGDGASGIAVWAANGGNATATNRGTVTVTGSQDVGTATVRYSSTRGVRGDSRGGIGRAVNEAGGVITTGSMDANGVRTGGHGTYGLAAWNEGSSGRAEAVNHGTITTFGEQVTYPDGRVRSALGMEASSVSNSVHAENTGTITTWGRGAYGVQAWSSGGGSSLTVDGLNSGTVTTNGARGFGVFAGTGNNGSGGSATVVARNSGSVTTTGDNADAVAAYARVGGTTSNPNRVEAYSKRCGGGTRLSA